MNLGLWKLIISLRDDIGRILERTLLPSAQTVTDSSNKLSVIDAGALSQLRSELRTHLDSLKDALNKELTENDAYLVMFPLVLLCDEIVMSRLPKQQHTEWRLLQHELFQINYGGDVFYDFIDERLAKTDTPPMVFEVLYFCLSAGFVGKFGVDGGKVQRYKKLLAERIPGARIHGPGKRRQRDLQAPLSSRAALETSPTEEQDSARGEPSRQRSAAATWYYGLALGGIVLAVFGVLVFTNL